MADIQPTLLNENAAAKKLVTEENVKAALEKDKGLDAVFKSFEVIDFTAKGDNYSCFVTSVKVCYSLSGEAKCVTYIVKLNPCKSLPAFEPFTAQVFDKEAKFYTDFVPELNSIFKKLGQPPLRVPRAIHAGYESKKEIIFLEDMRPKSFKMFDRMKGMDEPHVFLVIQELARLHAASVLLEESLGSDLVEKFPFFPDLFTESELDGTGQEMFQQMFTGFVQTGAQIAEKLQGYEKVAKFLYDMAPNCLEIVKSQMQSTPPFRVVCHGDCWNNNLLFRYDEDGKPLEVCLLDLQINRVGSPGLDLNYFLFTSLNGDTRKQGLKSFLSAYFSNFEKVFAAATKPLPFTQDELYAEYRARNLFGLLMSLMVIPIVVMDSTKTPDFQDISEENIMEKMEEQKKLVLDMVDTSPVLRPRFLDMFHEMIEHGIIKT